MRSTTAVGSGLFAAWVVHDAEELMTLRSSARRVAARVPRWLPIPADVRAVGFRAEQVRVAMAIMGALLGAAAVDGVRTRGRGWFFQEVLNGFGWHGVGHVAAGVAMRGYVTGVVTSPTVVIPFWLWATRALAAEGVPVRRRPTWGTLAVPPAILGAHWVSRRLVGPRQAEA